jgi:hypothetical protein
MVAPLSYRGQKECSLSLASFKRPSVDSDLLLLFSTLPSVFGRWYATLMARWLASAVHEERAAALLLTKRESVCCGELGTARLGSVDLFNTPLLVFLRERL